MGDSGLEFWGSCGLGLYGGGVLGVLVQVEVSFPMVYNLTSNSPFSSHSLFSVSRFAFNDHCASDVGGM